MIGRMAPSNKHENDKTNRRREKFPQENKRDCRGYKKNDVTEGNARIHLTLG
jgi:hypothetical protein